MNRITILAIIATGIGLTHLGRILKKCDNKSLEKLVKLAEITGLTILGIAAVSHVTRIMHLLEKL